MSKMKKIADRYMRPYLHQVGDGFKPHNYFPMGNDLSKEVSPFILLDYNPPTYFPPTNHRRGVGAHPHRGFETVTIVYEGKLQHRDTSGGGGIIGPGEVQWMTAASGVLHDEFHHEELKNGGNLHMIQLWVNLPARYKMSPPKYQAITAENIAELDIDDVGSVARIIAGELKGVKGPANTFTPINLFDLHLEPESYFEFSVPEKHNTMILVTEGSLQVNSVKTANFKDMILFEHEGEQISLRANEKSSVLVLSGEPIDEPVASYGPFVMNTQEELIQAVQDFNSGKFGTLSD